MTADISRIGRDQEALEVFYRDHIDRIQRFVAARVRDPHRVADLVADIFVAAVESAERYQPGRGSPTGWLYGIAANVVAGDLRREQRELRAVGRVSGRRLLDPDSIARIEERIDAERAMRDLLPGLAALSEDDRALFELVSLDGLSVRDAAQALGVKPGTARVRLHRCRSRVREHAENHRSAAWPSPAREEVTP
ncbi:MAG: RNA polymerase sigma factor [Nocardioides sp.]